MLVNSNFLELLLALRTLNAFEPALGALEG
jgi:hypothetical protein